MSTSFFSPGIHNALRMRIRSLPRLLFMLFVLPAATLSVAPHGLAQSRGIAIEPMTNTAKTPYMPGQYRALIIGNDQYSDPTGRWFSLNTAVADAKAVEHLLKTDYGFSDVTRLVNASRREILLALADLSKRVLPNDSVLVFYAGHGYVDSSTNKGFWVPSDAIGTDHTTFLRNSTIRDELSTIANRSKHTLLIADSCFSGTLLRRGASAPAAENINDKYYKKVANKKSVQIITSGGVEYVDDDYRKSGHSPFTYFLLNELKHNDNPMITVSEVSANVTKAVANNVDQTPNNGVLAGSGDELGEFIFVKVKMKVDVQGVPRDKVKVQVEVLPSETTSETGATDNSAAQADNASEQDQSTAAGNASPQPVTDDIIFPIPSL